MPPSRPMAFLRTCGVLLTMSVLYYQRKTDSEMVFASSNPGKNRSTNNRTTGTELTYLSSERIDALGNCADGVIQYAALHFQHVGKTSRVGDALKRVLPSGEYQVSSKLTSTCFTQHVLHQDLVSRSSIKLNGDCLQDTEIAVNRTESLTLKGIKRPSRRCADFVDAFTIGYWLNGTIWKPSGCTYPELSAGEMELPAKLVIHMAGDSVVRNMFNVFCGSIEAMVSYIFRVNGKRVRQHCCTVNANICLTFRMTWFPLADFRPETVRANYPTKIAYCHNAPDEVVCVENTPEIIFHRPNGNTGLSVWHWLFYGSHSDLLGASNSTCELLRSLTAPVNENLLIFDSPAIREDLIPDKYTPQRSSRTNARISAISSILPECVGRRQAFPIFPMTFALPESVFADAIHLNAEASTLVAHTVMSAFLAFLNKTDSQ